jgi:hypothetical protein
MRFPVLALLAVLLAGGMLAAQQNQTPPTTGGEALEKKIKELRTQIDEFSRKQKALEQEQKVLLDKLAEFQAKEAVEKKKHYAKAEIRGNLSRLHDLPWTCQIAVNDLTWNLDFSGMRMEWQVLDKLLGKDVVITGRVASVRHYPLPVTLIVESIELAK